MYQVLIVLASVCALACGLGISLPVAPNDRIVGGTNTSIEAVPYTASVQRNGEHICGGSIITNRHVLTAASCVYDALPSSLSVRAGSSNRKDGIVTKVSKIAMHPHYNAGTIDYDVSVLVLSGSLTLGPGVRPVGLANVPPAAGAKCTVSGWGLTYKSGVELPTQLQSAQVTIMDRTLCAIYRPGTNITDRMLCAGELTGGKDACQGDSGGPLVCNGDLAGVVSSRVGCGDPFEPTIYANVAALLDFIESVING